MRQVSFPPEELAHLYPDREPITVRYPRDIRKYHPVFFAEKLLTICSKATSPYELTKVTYNCEDLENMRRKLRLDQDVSSPPKMSPLIGTSR
jgi:hypothetical protein